MQPARQGPSGLFVGVHRAANRLRFDLAHAGHRTWGRILPGLDGPTAARRVFFADAVDPWLVSYRTDQGMRIEYLDGAASQLFRAQRLTRKQTP